MIYCNKCNMSLPDGANVCPYCGAVQNNGNTYQSIPNTPHGTTFSSAYYTGEAQPRYGTNPYSADEGERFWFQQKLTECINDVSTARGLGIVSIICGIITSFCIICWICGAIGIAKANSAMRFAESTGNFQLYDEAKRAKSLNKIGLIVSAVLIGIGIAAMLLFTLVIGLETST